MAKGKKFDAAEKHFQGRIHVLEGKIKALTNESIEKDKAYHLLKIENDKLTFENNKLQDWVERLLEYTKMTREDLKAMCEKDKKVAEIADILLFSNKIMGGTGRYV